MISVAVKGSLNVIVAASSLVPAVTVADLVMAAVVCVSFPGLTSSKYAFPPLAVMNSDYS